VEDYPLTVRRRVDDSAKPAVNLGDGVAVGDEVLVALVNDQLFVLGRTKVEASEPTGLVQMPKFGNPADDNGRRPNAVRLDATTLGGATPDFNTVIESGYYSVTNGSNSPNTVRTDGGSSWYYLEHQQQPILRSTTPKTQDYARQRATDLFGTYTRVWERRKNAGTWTTWAEVTVTPWTQYTPTFSVPGGGAAIGNGTIYGSWRRVGTSITARFAIIFGTTSTYGAASQFEVSLPFVSVGGPPPPQAIGVAWLYDTSALLTSVATVMLAPNVSVVQFRPHGQTNIAHSTVPWTWASGDQIRGSIEYEVAA
jgi:hypothetical protein